MAVHPVGGHEVGRRKGLLAVVMRIAVRTRQGGLGQAQSVDDDGNKTLLSMSQSSSQALSQC